MAKTSAPITNLVSIDRPTVNPSIAPWLETQPADAEVVALRDAWQDSAERLAAIQRRERELKALRAANDHALGNATDEDRASVITERASIIAEADAWPAQFRRVAAATASAELRFLRAVKRAATIDHNAAVDLLNPFVGARNSIRKKFNENENRSRELRMSEESARQLRDQDTEIVADMSPIVRRRDLALAAIKGADHLANSRYSDNAKGVRITLDTSSESSWSEQIRHYVERLFAAIRRGDIIQGRESA